MCMSKKYFAVIHVPQIGGNSSGQLDSWVGVKLEIPADFANTNAPPYCVTMSGDSRTVQLIIPSAVALEALGMHLGVESDRYLYWEKALTGSAGLELQSGEFTIEEC